MVAILHPRGGKAGARTLCYNYLFDLVAPFV